MPACLQANQPNVTASDGRQLGLGRVPWLPAGTFGGDGTAFSEAVPNTGKGFACSFRYLNDWASTHFAAMNAAQVGADSSVDSWGGGL